MPAGSGASASVGSVMPSFGLREPVGHLVRPSAPLACTTPLGTNSGALLEPLLARVKIVASPDASVIRYSAGLFELAQRIRLIARRRGVAAVAGGEDE